MQIEVTEIQKSELECLLSTATYGSQWLECHILKSENNLDNIQDFNDREEHWAHRLLNGGHLMCYDYFDEDENGNPAEYEISIEDFYKGFSKAISECPFCLANFINDKGDYNDANAIMQVIIFGGVIYG